MALILNSLKVIGTSYLIVLAFSTSGEYGATGRLIETEVSWSISGGMLLCFLVRLLTSSDYCNSLSVPWRLSLIKPLCSANANGAELMLGSAGRA